MARPAVRAGLIGGVALALGAVALPTTAGAAAALLHVVVDNTDANPVPVRGTINVGNLPVPGDIVDPQPFEARQNLTLTEGEGFAGTFFTIPAGQQLTAEFLSVHIILPPGQVPQVSFNADSGGTGGFVPLEAVGVTDGLNGPVANYSAAIPNLDFHTSTFRVDLQRDLPGSFAYPGEARMAVYLSGHLTPA